MPIGHAFIELETVDSTNNYAMAKATSGQAGHGTIYFARHQWAGKGQRGREWTSKPGENIILSAVLEPVAFAPSKAFHLSAAVALACDDLFARYAGAAMTRIKWPNDLYWNDRKAGGILIENKLRGERWAYAIVGIGINVNQTVFPDTVSNPVSLRQITGRAADPMQLARELAVCLEHRFTQLQSNPDAIFASYNLRLYGLGREVTLRAGEQVLRTVVTGVSADGKLLTRDSEDRSFSFGDVEWII
ncbi:MAG TPA: biotin--[acetyl-CoA-carboxylase] ligase [Puia sp.]|nr:biotin--[acetyl-CoA-carboxylase] ligase [Puia sp.]